MDNKKPTYQELEEQLQASQKNLDETQFLCRIGSWDWNVVTNEVKWSNMMFRLLGLKPQEVTPSYELALHHVHNKDKERYEKTLTTALTNQTSYYLENTVIRKDNSLLLVISRGECHFNVAGDLVRMIGTIQDISRERNLIKEKRKAEKSERIKTTFFENITHEIKTPLTAILSSAELLQQNKLSPENQQRCLQHIKSGSKRLLVIISDILELSKIEANNQKLHAETFELNKVINDLLEEYNLINKNGALRLQNNNGLEDGNDGLQTDRIKLIQILTNFLNNALKFTDQGIIEFGYTVEDNNLQFYVKDTGVGISFKNQLLIFERFQQIENEKQNDGNGFGLPIAKGLVHFLGGKIWVESKVGAGSTFFFTIPYVKV